jgi:hypothetical protein
MTVSAAASTVLRGAVLVFIRAAFLSCPCKSGEVVRRGGFLAQG